MRSLFHAIFCVVFISSFSYGQTTVIDSTVGQTTVINRTPGQTTVINRTPDQTTVINRTGGQATLIDGSGSQTTVIDRTGLIQTGFVVITPLSGDGQGLSVSETFGQQFGGNFFQASVLPSPLVTSTSVVMSTDPSTGINTGIAIVNPNASQASVTLNLRNQQGISTSNRVLTVGGHQQVSQFATELFAGDPAVENGTTGLLFISSLVSVGVLGLSFSGPSFSSLPVATQTGVGNVTVVAPTTTMFPRNIGIAPVSPIAPPFATNTGVVVIGAAAPFPELGSGIGGPGSILLPQIATGGGWVSQITIANSGSFPQTVRVDFFDSNGGPLVLPFGSSIPNVFIQPAGVVRISTAGTL